MYGYVWWMGIQKPMMWGTPNHKASSEVAQVRVYWVYHHSKDSCTTLDVPLSWFANAQFERPHIFWIWCIWVSPRMGDCTKKGCLKTLHRMVDDHLPLNRLNLGILGREPLWAHRHLRIWLHRLQGLHRRNVSQLQDCSYLVHLHNYDIGRSIWYFTNRGKFQATKCSGFGCNHVHRWAPVRQLCSFQFGVSTDIDFALMYNNE